MAGILYNVVVLIPGIATDNRACWGYTVFVQELAPTIKVEDVIEMGSSIGPVVEVRLFMRDQKAHVRFTTIEHAILFMELFNRRPYRTGRGRLEFRPLMSPSSDYPCLAVTGLPDNTTEDALLHFIRRQIPNYELVRIIKIIGNRGIAQFASQRIANNVIKHTRRVTLMMRGKPLKFDWEGTPVARVNNIQGFTQKEKLFAAFDVIQGGHVLGVAMLQDRAFVYFDYRFNLEAAAAVIGDQVRITMDDGSQRSFRYVFL